MTAEEGQAIFDQIVVLVLNAYIIGIGFGMGIKLFKQLWKGNNDE